MTSIRERIMANWLTTVAGISVANGFNTDPGLVDRFKLISMDQDANILIEIRQGTDRRDGQGETLGWEYRVLTIHMVIKVRHFPEVDGLSTDTVFNAIEEDLHTAVMFDLSRGGLAIPPGTQFESSEVAEPDEAGGRAVKDVTYTVTYRHVRGDMTS